MSLAFLREKKLKDEKKRNDLESLEFESLEDGDGCNFPRQGDIISMHFTCSTKDGTILDTTRTKNYPQIFTLGNEEVIKGIDDIFLYGSVSPGQRFKITCTPELAYGEKGIPPIIPPNMTLYYEIEFLSFQPFQNTTSITTTSTTT